MSNSLKLKDFCLILNCPIFRGAYTDSFFTDNDLFVFCEYTTQERLKRNESFFSKLKKDVDHCFDSSKTKIDNQKISTIILGTTGTILPSELIELQDLVKRHNPRAKLLTYTIQQLPHKLLFFPGLADRYIPGLKTTKGSILTLQDFLGSSERGLQPSLTNPFVGRETDIEKAKLLLTQFDVLILKGYQGVGKSRLAVHLAELYEAQEYQISFTKAQVDVLKSLPNPLKYLSLVSFFENRIVSLLEHKQQELKHDFVGW